jgi:hypothetical protein
MPDPARLQTQAARAKTILQWTAIGLLALFAAERLSPPVMAIFHGAPAPFAPLGAALVQLLPAILYTYALWALHGAFARIEAGVTFAKELPMALKRTGWALIGGGAAAVAIVPIGLRMLGRGPAYVFELDASAIAIAALGAGLIVLARLVAEAAEAKAELDGFF